MTEDTRAKTVYVPRDSVRSCVVDGNVTVNAGSDWGALTELTMAACVGEYSQHGLSEAIVRGDASATSAGMAMAVTCDAWIRGNESRVLVEGDVCAEGASTWGISQEADDRSDEDEQGRPPLTTVEVGGDVMVRSRCDQARGVFVKSCEDTRTTIRGSVDVFHRNERDEEWIRHREQHIDWDLWDEFSNGNAAGICARIGGNTTAVAVQGDVRTTVRCRERNGFAAGVDVESTHGKTSIVVGGSIVAQTYSDPGEFAGVAQGVLVCPHEGGDVFVRAGGIVAQSDNAETVGVRIRSECDSSGSVEVQVLGDIESSGQGIVLSSRCVGEGCPSSFRVLVDGTVAAQDYGICVGEQEVYGDHIISTRGTVYGEVDITVWKILAGCMHMMVRSDGNVSGYLNYIVRVEQTDGAKIKVLSELEEKSFRDIAHTYRVAREGDVLRFRVEPGEGHSVTAVYGIDGGPALTPAADGTYQVVVPRGGGVRLRAVSS